MTDKAPIGTLICDAPPGRVVILSVPGPVDYDTMEQIRSQWNRAMRGDKIVVLDDRIKVRVLDGTVGGWHDWEHSAA